MFRTVEFLANVIIVVLGLSVVALLIARATGSVGTAPPTGGGPRVGTHFKGIDQDPIRPTLVLALSTQCSACASSVGFHRRIADLARERGIAVAAMLPQDNSVAAAYLSSHRIQVDHLVKLDRSAGVNGFPTLILLEPGGLIEAVWLGALGEASEREIEERLSAAGPK